MGCSLAHHLAAHQLPALLLERGQLGAGSTARCAGGVRQQFSTTVNVEVGMLSRRLLERFPEEVGAPAGLRQIGYLFVASTIGDHRQLLRNLEVQRAAGLRDVRLLNPAEITELVPELTVEDVLAGSFCPSDGLAGPNEVTAGYVAAARRGGAIVVEGCAVRAIDRTSAGGYRVHTDGGDVDTPLVVDCAGPQAAAVAAMVGLSIPVRPFRRHLFLTEPLALRRDPPMTVDMGTSFYFHPEGDGLLLGMSDPAEPPSFDTSVDWSFLEHLVEHATHRLPPLAGTAIRTGWAGLYEVSPDHQAIVGESRLPGFWLCCGFSGHGFMQAPAVGRLLAAMIAGAAPEVDISAFAPDRFDGGGGEPELAVI